MSEVLAGRWDPQVKDRFRFRFNDLFVNNSNGQEVKEIRVTQVSEVRREIEAHQELPSVGVFEVDVVEYFV